MCGNLPLLYYGNIYGKVQHVNWGKFTVPIYRGLQVVTYYMFTTVKLGKLPHMNHSKLPHVNRGKFAVPIYPCLHVVIYYIFTMVKFS